MSCSYPNREETLVSYAYDELDAFEKKAFALHLSSCDICLAEATGFVELRDQLATWSPPDLVGTAVRPQPSAAASQRRWLEMPAWMQVAAAVLVLGVSAGAANLRIDIGSRGISMRTGWLDTSPKAAPDAALVTREELATVRREFQGALASIGRQAPALVVPAHASEDDVIRHARLLIADSEKRQQSELALRLADLRQDISIQRQVDMTKVQQQLSYIDRSAYVANQRTINSLNSRLAQTVSQTAR
jgi:hypothetical protein